MSLVVYGIPTCGTVKKAQRWLLDRSEAWRDVDLRKTPPSAQQIRAWVAAFGVSALTNTSGGSYRALGPEKDGWQEERWIQAFAADPMLIKRPVIERDGAPVLVGFNAPDEEIARRLGLSD